MLTVAVGRAVASREDFAPACRVTMSIDCLKVGLGVDLAMWSHEW